MKKLIYVLLAVACFVCADLNSDDKQPQGVVMKIERKNDKEGKLRVIIFSYEKDDKEVGWLKIIKGGVFGENVPHLEWSGGYPFSIDYENKYYVHLHKRPHLRKISDGMGGYRFPYIFRPPYNWDESIAPVPLKKYEWNDKCFIGFQLVQNAKEND